MTDRVRQYFQRLRAFFQGESLDRDLDAEMAAHLELAIEENLRRGMSADEARRQALIRFGGVAQAREQHRETRGLPALDSLLQDLRFAFRQLRKNPGFATIAIVVVALGVGATTAIFSAVNPILFEPLPYPHPSRILMLWDYGANGSPLEVTFGTFREILQRSRSFEALAVADPWQPTLLGANQPERLDGQSVSADYFRVLGVPPALGRNFQPSDDVLNGPNVVILSYGLWQRRFAGAPAIIGRQIKLDDNLWTVIGVMPSQFENVIAPAAELWRPLQYNTVLTPMSREWGHHLRMVGRIRPGITPAQATQEIESIAHHPLRDFPRVPWAALEQGLMVIPLQESVTAAVKPALLAVLCAVMLVLLIACVNVTNLLLARGARRRGEFGMRVALGAGRLRLTRQLITETLLLAGIGGALGIGVAEFGIDALLALSPPGLPRLGAIRLDSAVFVFAFAITTLVGMVVGLIPAVQASRNDPHAGLQQSSQRTAGGQQGTRRALVVVEVALALVLLVSAGLLLRSLQHLFAIDPGFDASHVLTLQVQESGHRYDQDSARLHFYQLALDAVRRVPGVVSAGFTEQLPLSGDFEVYGLQFEKDTGSEGALRYAITPGYMETMRIPLRRGRLFDERDTATAPKVVLINQSFAQHEFPGQDPIGRRVCVRCDPGPEKPWATIVGVVGDVRQVSLEPSDTDAVYMPNSQWYWADTSMSLVVRTHGNAAALTAPIKRAIWSVDRDVPIIRVATMDHLLTVSQAQRHFALILFETFALVALVLAATGLYGILSGSVTERMREIGVRCALGASRGSILALVIRQGMALTGVGVFIGLGGAVIASGAIITLLFGVSRLDPVTYLAVIVLLAGVSALACWLPAWRAAQIDPATTLRAE
jgi:putative ABC transport system permease protein